MDVPYYLYLPATLEEIDEALISIGYSMARDKWGS